MSDLAVGQLGPEVSYDVAFAGGNLQVSMKYAGAQAGASVALNISAAQLIGALAAKVASPLEKSILIGLESIIASIP